MSMIVKKFHIVGFFLRVVVFHLLSSNPPRFWCCGDCFYFLVYYYYLQTLRGGFGDMFFQQLVLER